MHVQKSLRVCDSLDITMCTLLLCKPFAHLHNISCVHEGVCGVSVWCMLSRCSGTDSAMYALQKAGPKFEATVRNKEKANPRFAFLLPWNQYHQYYR